MKRPKLYTYNGETKTLEDWALKVGMSKAALRQRLYIGWDFGRAVTTPHTKRKHKLNGELYTLAEISKMNPEIQKGSMAYRLRVMSVKEAVERPKRNHTVSNPTACLFDCFKCPYDDCIVDK